MKKYTIKKVVAICLLPILLLNSSCSDFFDENTDDIGLEDNVYKQSSEIYAGFIGVLSSFQAAADDYVVTSELLGNMIKPTAKAPSEFWDIYRYKATTGNQYASPEAYYNIVVNCNDYLRHIVKFNKNNPGSIPPALYRGLVSSTICFRTWAYMTIGKIYGEAVYYDLALSDDLGMEQGRTLSLDELVSQLITFMRTGVDGVNGYHRLDVSLWKEMLTPRVDRTVNDWVYTTLHPDVLMAELYLWNKDNVNAAQSALGAISSGIEDDGKESTDKYKLSGYFQGGTLGATRDWGSIFTDFFAAVGNEAFTAVPFDYSEGQVNNLQYYFSNYSPNVHYLEPTKLIRAGGIYHQHQDGRIDPRYRYTVNTENGEPVMSRYHLSKAPYKHDHHIYIYRAAEVWLMAAEALSNLGDFAQADSIINSGLKPSSTGSAFKAPFDSPIYTWNMRESRGLRGRAGASKNYLKDYAIEALYTDPKEFDKRRKFAMDSLIANEVACELAGEGKLWFTLVRMARNNNNPIILAKPISDKFDGGEKEIYKMWLMDPQKWFIKYDQLSNK